MLKTPRVVDRGVVGAVLVSIVETVGAGQQDPERQRADEDERLKSVPKRSYGAGRRVRRPPRPGETRAGCRRHRRWRALVHQPSASARLPERRLRIRSRVRSLTRSSTGAVTRAGSSWAGCDSRSSLELAHEPFASLGRNRPPVGTVRRPGVRLRAPSRVTRVASRSASVPCIRSRRSRSRSRIPCPSRRGDP